MKKLSIVIVSVIVFFLLFALSEYLYSQSIQVYRIFGWVLATAIASSTYLLLRAYNKPLYHSLYDNLTGLPNRYLFQENLEQAIAYANRNAQKVHLLYLKLKQFQEIKNMHGDEIGDKVLIEVAKRLREALRASDIIARIDNNMFAVIPRDIEDDKYFFEVIDKLTATISQTIIIDGNSLSIELSISTSSYPENGLKIEELIQHITS